MSDNADESALKIKAYYFSDNKSFHDIKGHFTVAVLLHSGLELYNRHVVCFSDMSALS